MTAPPPPGRDPAGGPARGGYWGRRGRGGGLCPPALRHADERFPFCEDDRMTAPRHDPLAMHPTSHSFDVVLRGYDKSQVAETIEQLEADFRIALADRDAAVARSSDLASQLRSEEHTSELQSRQYLVCRLLLEKNTSL